MKECFISCYILCIYAQKWSLYIWSINSLNVQKINYIVTWDFGHIAQVYSGVLWLFPIWNISPYYREKVLGLYNGIITGKSLSLKASLTFSESLGHKSMNKCEDVDSQQWSICLPHWPHLSTLLSPVTYLPGEPSFGGRASPGGAAFQPDWRGRRRHTVWQHGTAERQEAAQSYTHPLYTLASSSLPEGRGWWRERWVE